jgi:hypothetical protein
MNLSGVVILIIRKALIIGAIATKEEACVSICHTILLTATAIQTANGTNGTYATAAANVANKSPGSECSNRQVTAIGNSDSCFT